jgi:AhpD family alkylhydroperoxidase
LAIWGERTNRKRLEQEAPDLFYGFNDLVKRCYGPGALDRKYKELMAITAAVATRCVPCLGNHLSNAITAGASKEEIFEAAAIGVEFGGGPSFVVVRDHLLEFYEELVPPNR